jgi:dihydrolipoamide dehydrogenase
MVAAGWPGNADMLNLAAGVSSDRKLRDRRRLHAHFATAHICRWGPDRTDDAGAERRNDRLASRQRMPFCVGQPYAHTIVPHGGFTDPEYGSVGLTEKKRVRSGGEYVSLWYHSPIWIAL